MNAARFNTPSIRAGHPDFELLVRVRDGILNRVGGEEDFRNRIPSLLQDAIDFVLDPVRTARTAIDNLDNVEKTFIGLKVEHVIRDYLDVPKGLRDLRIDDVDVDVKNTVGGTWMIPPETYRNQEPCLLIAIADREKRCWLGLMVARNEYLGASEGNRDGKRSVVQRGLQNVLWLISNERLPESRWAQINMERFRELRQIRGGSKRAADFFRENIGVVVHRSILQSLLHDQDDYMKRIRKNGGARDILRREGIALLSGAYGSSIIRQTGHRVISRDEFIAIKAMNPDERKLLKASELID